MSVWGILFGLYMSPLTLVKCQAPRTVVLAMTTVLTVVEGQAPRITQQPEDQHVAPGGTVGAYWHTGILTCAF